MIATSEEIWTLICVCVGYVLCMVHPGRQLDMLLELIVNKLKPPAPIK